MVLPQQCEQSQNVLYLCGSPAYVCATSCDVFVFSLEGEECGGSDGWTPWKRNCYKLSAAPANWTSANLSCIGQSSHLISIHNPDENNLLSGLAHILSQPAPVWIGLTDISYEGSYKWSDGTTLNHSQWRIEPPSGNGLQDCSYFDASQQSWSISECGVNRHFVCKRPAASTKPVVYKTKIYVIPDRQK